MADLANAASTMSFSTPPAVALAFLTRLPVRHGPVNSATLAASLPYFPAVGAALGAMLAGLATLINRWHPAPGALLAVLLTACAALGTGGLHLDGTADVFDAMSGGRGDRGRTLAILRDSRIGSHGATALVLLLAAKVTAQTTLLADAHAWMWMLAMAWARCGVVFLVVAFPTARPAGLGASFAEAARWPHAVAATLVPAALILWVGPSAWLPVAVAAGVIGVVAVWCYRRLGGLTGDVHGAAIELAEAAFWVTLALQMGA